MKRRGWFGALLALMMCAACACGAQAEGVLVLPQALTAIEERAFENDAALRRLVLPDGVTAIGSRAFAGSGLNEINFPPAMTAIADDAFADCGHIEVHTLTVDGLMTLAQLAANGCDVSWADEVFNAVQTYSLRAAAGQWISRGFLAPVGGTYTFTVSGAEELRVSCYDMAGSLLQEGGSSVSVDLRPDNGVWIDCRFADPKHSGDFSLIVSRVDQPMMDVVYTPQLWVYKDGEPVRNAEMNGSLAQLGIGEVLTPVLAVQNTGNYRVAGQVSAKLDGETVDLGFFALGAQESGVVAVPSEEAFAAEIPGSHAIEYTVEFEGEEKVASMTWETEGERPAQEQAAVVRQGANTIELSAAQGNLFRFTPSKNGVYKIGTSAQNCDTYAALRNGKTGEILVEDDDAGSPYQNFVFSRTLKAQETVWIDIGMKNFKGATDVTLNITYIGTPNLKYSHSLYVFDGGSWRYADDGRLDGSGMIKLKDKGDLSTLEIDEFLTPVMVIANSSGKAVPLGLTALLDGEPILWHNSCEVAANSTFVAYLDTAYARMYEKPGEHTIDYYLNGKLATSYTWEVSGRRTPHIFDGTPMLQLGENYRSLDDDDGSFDWFKAPCPGMYRFYSLNSFYDPRAVLFDEEMNILAYNDDDGDSEDFAIYQYLEAGQIVYLHSMIYEDSRDTAKIWVDLVSAEAAPSLELALGEAPLPMAAGETFTASFTAPYAGEFMFYAEQGYYNGSITGRLYDTYWREKTLSGTGYNGYFQMRCVLEAGETVYLKTTCTKADSSAVLKISCCQQY